MLTVAFFVWPAGWGGGGRVSVFRLSFDFMSRAQYPELAEFRIWVSSLRSILGIV